MTNAALFFWKGIGQNELHCRLYFLINILRYSQYNKVTKLKYFFTIFHCLC